MRIFRYFASQSFFYLLLIVISHSSFADNIHLTSEYKTQTLLLLQELKSQGVEQIGCSRLSQECPSLETLELQLEKDLIQYKALPRFDKYDGALRWTGFSSPREKTIFLNASEKHPESLIGFIGLHELLWQWGSMDADYRYTMIAWMYLQATESNPSKKLLLNSLQSKVSQKKGILTGDSFLISPEGGTIVGGGGDYRAFDIRRRVAKKIIDEVPESIRDSYASLQLISMVNGIDFQKQSLPMEFYYSSPVFFVPKTILISDERCLDRLWGECAREISDEIFEYYKWTSPLVSHYVQLPKVQIFSKLKNASFFVPKDIEAIQNVRARVFFEKMIEHFCFKEDACVMIRDM